MLQHKLSIRVIFHEATHRTWNDFLNSNAIFISHLNKHPTISTCIRAYKRNVFALIVILQHIPFEESFDAGIDEIIDIVLVELIHQES